MAVAEQGGREAELRPNEAPKVNVARHRRDNDRQGLSQRRGGEADEGVWRAQLHSREETEGTAELGGQTGRAASGVCEPASGAG